jgi:phage internal scaffolding protein
MGLLNNKFDVTERGNGSRKVSLQFKDHSKTKQSEKQSCDINYIINRYQKTGELPLYQRTPIYGDFADVPTYQESLNVLRDAHEQFDNLPAKVREKFKNNPERFLEFVSDESNKPAMMEMGLIPKVKETSDGNEPARNKKNPPNEEE